MNNNKEWLEGIKAREHGAARDTNPYATTAADGNMYEADLQTSRAINWFGGWDVAAIILQPV